MVDTRQLTTAEAFHVLASVCSDLGLDGSDTTLLGPVGDNAVILLPAEKIVARIAWGVAALPRVRRELEIAAWLAEQGFPAVRQATRLEQPVVKDGRIISFWEEIPAPVVASTSEMGRLLKQLHRLPEPPGDVLAPMDPFVRQEEHIKAPSGLRDEDRVFLIEKLHTLRSAHADLAFDLPPGVIHGDPHRKNILRSSGGQVLLLDLERFGIGPREWDLIVPAVYRRVGWYEEAEYEAFVDAYGWDVTGWEGFSTLAEIRELRMTTWLVARTAREPRLIPEARHRIATLRDPELPRRWQPGT